MGARCCDSSPNSGSTRDRGEMKEQRSAGGGGGGGGDAARRSKLGTSNPGGRPGRYLQPPPLRSRLRYRRYLPCSLSLSLSLEKKKIAGFFSPAISIGNNRKFSSLGLSDYRIASAGCVLFLHFATLWLPCGDRLHSGKSAHLSDTCRERFQDSLSCICIIVTNNMTRV